MRHLIKNIGLLAGIHPADCLRLCGEAMAGMPTIANAYLLIEDGLISSFGKLGQWHGEEKVDIETDARGGIVLPSWCDAHTHIVYAGSREQEFVDKIRGLSYADIARRGGGILNSADRLHETSEDELFRQSMVRVREVMAKGTGCLEIKSGYGLTTADELKMLRVIRRIKDSIPIKVVSTFLGAHAVGRAFTGRQSEYVDLVIHEMIPEVTKERLADFIDVFCDEGFFTLGETERILEAGEKYGLRAKIHADELAASGGTAVGVRHYAQSVDHLESAGDEEMALLRDSATMPTVLPGTSFFLNMPYAPARKMIDAGLGVAIASDYNPGSTPSGDMRLAVSLGCIKMRLLPEEAINAATLNGAYAMNLSQSYGSIAVGKVANLQITKPIPSLAFLPYAYTTPLIDKIIIRGELH